MLIARNFFMNSMASQKVTTLVLVDDDARTRGSWGKILNAKPGFHCIGEYGTGEEAVSGILKNPPDIVLMDISLPGLSGIDCVGQLKPQLPQVEFIMLTAFSDQDRIFDALRAGASGYLLKRSTTKNLIDAIQQVQSGGAPMTPEIARQVTSFFYQAATQSQRSTAVLEGLGGREAQILKLLSAGSHYKEIADQLDISIDTVRTHIRRIYRKLQVHSRMEAVAKFLGH